MNNTYMKNIYCFDVHKFCLESLLIWCIFK